MSEVVVGVTASHSTLMNTDWQRVESKRDAQGFRAALEDARTALAAAEPDVLVCIGSNHFRGMYLDLMPQFTIGVGECVASGEARTPEGPLPVHPDFARFMCRNLVEAGFDIAYSLRLQVDHGIAHALQYLTPELDTPVVPVIVNTFAPPLPSLSRCDALGHAIARAVSRHRGDLRVAVIGSGGLSHQLPWPKWENPVTDDDRFLVAAWRDGRGRWEDFETRRRAIVRGATARISEEFDRAFLEHLKNGTVRDVLCLSEDDVENLGGNGAHEIRSWIATAAATGDRSANVFGYWPISDWLTGMAVAVFEPLTTKR